MLSLRTKRRRALRPQLESLEGRVVLSAVFDSVIGVGNETSAITPSGNAMDAAGNSYVTGTLMGVMDLDPAVDRPDHSDILTPRGKTDAFVAKYAPDNSLVWARRMGGDNTNNDFTTDSGSGVAVDSTGNVFVTGRFNGQSDFGPFSLTSAGDSDGFVTKLDPNGSVLWAKRWGGTTRDDGADIAVDAAGNVVTVGSTLLVNSAGGQSYTGFEVRKFSPTGAAVWNKRIDNSGGTAVSVATDAAGNVFLGGQFYGTTDFNPDSTKTNYVTGANKMAVNGGANSYVLKLTASGSFSWVAPFIAKTAEATNSWVFFEDLAVDAGGNVFVGGFQTGQVDINPSSSGDYRLSNSRKYNGFVAKLSSGGSLSWASQTGGDMNQRLAVDPSGAVYVTGTFGSGPEAFTPGSGLPAATTRGGTDVFVTKFTPTGAQDWAVTFGGTGFENTRSIAVNASGMIYVVGMYPATVDFDPDPLTTYELNNQLFNNMFLLKLRKS